MPEAVGATFLPRAVERCNVAVPRDGIEWLNAPGGCHSAREAHLGDCMHDWTGHTGGSGQSARMRQDRGAASMPRWPGAGPQCARLRPSVNLNDPSVGSMEGAAESTPLPRGWRA